MRTLTKFPFFLICSVFLEEAIIFLFSIFSTLIYIQRAKKVVSNSPGLVDFAIGLVNSVFNLPDGQVMFFEEFE